VSSSVFLVYRRLRTAQCILSPVNMTHKTMASSWQTSLPLELYSHTIKFVTPRSELPRICLVSRYFLHEGRRRLYRDNKFDNIYLLSKFIHAMLNYPHLANIVHGLTLHFPRYFEELYSKSGRGLIKATFTTLKNLKRLAIAGLSPTSLASLLTGCPFALNTFKSNTLLTQEMVDTLTTQNHISEWTYQVSGPDAQLPITFSNDFLPRLSVLSIPAHMLTQIPAQQWAISRLSLDLSGYGVEKEMRLGEVFKHFGPTLISLSLGRLRRKQQKMPMISLIARFAKETPRLRYLGVSDDSPPSTDEVLSLPTSSWTALRELQTFVWWVDDGISPEWCWSGSQTHCYPTPSSDTLATYLAFSCQTLKRFIFMSMDDYGGYVWSNGIRKRIPWGKEMEEYTLPGTWTWA